MSEPFLGEVRIFGFNFPPRGWAQCNGQLLPIGQNQSLYSLLGTTYGGDGRTTFGLPELRGRVPIHFEDGHPLGQRSGAETQQLGLNQIPPHTHTLMATDAAGNLDEPTATSVMAQAGGNLYGDFGAQVNTAGSSIGNAGASQGHNNMQPYLTLNFCIALQGLFPSRN